MEFLIIGIVSALNLIIIVSKFKRGRVEDAVFDTGLFAFLTIVIGNVPGYLGEACPSITVLVSKTTGSNIRICWA